MTSSSIRKLPIIETPTFYGKIPSTGKKFEFRPFLVKEQKILLMALESEDIDQIYIAFRDIILSCIRTPDCIDIDTSPSFDVESVFLQISSKSVGEISKVGVRCDHCETVNQLDVDISSQIVVKNVETYKNKEKNTIMLTDNVGMKMRVPSLQSSIELSKDTDKKESEVLFDAVVASIESVFDENNVYPMNEVDQKEIEEFIDSLSIDQMNKVQEFFNNIPYIGIDLEYNCTNCGKKNKQEIKGMQNFF